jgi:hypothetical protein
MLDASLRPSSAWTGGPEEILTQATVMLSQPVLIEQMIVPLMYRIGDRWHEDAAGGARTPGVGRRPHRIGVESRV